MRIVPLSLSDVPAAKRVIATVVLEYYFVGRFTPDELLARYAENGYLADLDQLTEIYDGRSGLFLGIFSDGQLVGTGGVRTIDAHTGELVRLWLLREFRGRGLGHQLTTELLRFARNTDWTRLRLDTSARCTNAVRLFRRLGFQDISAYKASIGDCFMELDLSAAAKPV